MNGNPQDDRSEGADRRLEDLAAGPSPPDSLEQRIVRSLKERGLIGVRAAVTSAVWAKLAAGVMTQRRLGPQPVVPDGPSFLLLLWEPASGIVEGAQPDDRLVEKYRAWAIGEAEQGRLVAGEKLAGTGRLLRRDADGIAVSTAPSAAEGETILGGYFLIRAAGLDEAVQIASTCPHLDYSGVIEVREIDHR
jgi:hypothetical protein